MESNPSLNAGRGSVLNQIGEVELDAAVMDGKSLAAGAVASVQGIENPVDLARRVMTSTPHVLLGGPGAESFAREQGIPTCDPSYLIVPHERTRWEEAKKKAESSPHPCDTVGAVACDGDGHVAAATSTGGSPLKIPGRIGDTPIIGAGLYADDELGAACSTGWGEGSIRTAMAFRAVSLIPARGPAEAAREAIGVLKARTRGQGGVILVDPQGNPGFHFNTPHMATAYLREGMIEPEIGI
jgi:beta-aspartyl-peptidase (threonine type)